MAPITDYKRILDIIDKTFTYHEKRLAELRKETINYMRQELRKVPTRPTRKGSARVPPTG